MQKNRVVIIDAFKGIAILLVVFGHAIQSNTSSFDENVFFRVIYSFHMPLFMFLAGLVASYSFEMPTYPFLKKKFMALAVPFMSWYALAYFANGVYQNITLKSYIGRVLLSPDWGLWFLWVLFLNFCFLVFAVKMEKGLGVWAFLAATIFVEWLKTSKLNAKDLIFIFSVGGGNLEKNISPNLVEALKLAKSVGAKITGVVGRDGGYTAQVADACVIVPTVNPDNVTPHSEAFQAVIWHLLVSHPKLKANQTKWESTTK